MIQEIIYFLRYVERFLTVEDKDLPKASPQVNAKLDLSRYYVVSNRVRVGLVCFGTAPRKKSFLR